MNLTALPAFSDNTIGLLDDDREAIVVDPGESAPVDRALDARGLSLAGILVTHRHTGGHVACDAVPAAGEAILSCRDTPRQWKNTYR